MPESATATAGARRENNCTNRADDDGDGLTDCADHDCATDAACKVGSGPENTDARCSDWFDNDGDGFIDCDDPDCEGGGVKVCKGSWQGPIAGASSTEMAAPEEDFPELKGGASVEDLIGKGSDKDGERSDELCSDGIDNDRDGRIDCADFGCRFDPDVTVCRGNPGMRFSLAGAIENTYELVNGVAETRINRLQMRTFGPIPGIENSFYYVGARLERTPRVTFALFQIPLSRGGHFLNVNSGGGGLSMQPVISTSQQLLLEPAYLVYSAFQQGNGAAVEVLGPISSAMGLEYRAYAAGGSGRSTGNVGGTYFTSDLRVFNWSAGGTVRANLIGYIGRMDSPMLYTPVATALATSLGAKFDQRTNERFPALHADLNFRSGRFVVFAEAYAKRELAFQFDALGYVVQAGALVWPKRVLLAADFGEFIAGAMAKPPAKLDTDLKKQRNERQWRAAAHVYFYRAVGVLTAMYRDRELQPLKAGDPTERERECTLAAQFRF
jgi:hypothetical protein